jgi:transcriptional regulator with XRE-family HTH domain
VNEVQLGSALRQIRVRLGLRQADVAARAGVPRATVSRIERGDLGRIPLGYVMAVAIALEASVDRSVRWHGGELPRLLNAGHAAMHEAIARLFRRRPDWLTAPEVSFSIYGERGVVDLLAFHPGTGALLVIELKSVLVDVEGLLSAVDRYRRLAPRLARERGWAVTSVSTCVLLRDTRTDRRRVTAHAAVLRSAFPGDARTLRRWLRTPVGTVNALGYLSIDRMGSTNARTAGITRVRPRRASVKLAAGAGRSAANST